MAKPRIKKYGGPAGGIGALEAVERHLCRQKILLSGNRTLLAMNKGKAGFDCPGCGWPDPKHTGSFEYCENGAKAVAWEATKKRTTPAFFAKHTVTELLDWSDFALENEGRLTHPMVYDEASDRYVPIAWEDAYALVGERLRALPDPDMAEFYTSGRASNEAAFLFQVFARGYGTNNFPDCSNMCHESTSVALPERIGVAKGTVLLEDFEKADLIMVFGQNPGTNSPRMLNDLRSAAKRGADIVAFNPLRERSLERFASPQHIGDIVKPVPISTQYYQVRTGGDMATVKGMMKVVLAADDAAVAAGGERVLDVAFIAAHTRGFDTLADEIRGLSWDAIVAESGLSRADIEKVGATYMKAKAPSPSGAWASPNTGPGSPTSSRSPTCC